jgi:hypothetical protein
MRRREGRSGRGVRLIEAEIADLDDEEKQMFLADLGSKNRASTA